MVEHFAPGRIRSEVRNLFLTSAEEGSRRTDRPPTKKGREGREHG
jgi:hypothetical protein